MQRQGFGSPEVEAQLKRRFRGAQLNCGHLCSFFCFFFFNPKYFIAAQFELEIELGFHLFAMLRIYQMIWDLYKFNGLLTSRNEFCMSNAIDVRETSPLCLQLRLWYISFRGPPGVWIAPLHTLTLIFQVTLENTFIATYSVPQECTICSAFLKR